MKKPVAAGAGDFGIPDTPLHHGLKNVRQHPDRPFVGRGTLRDTDQAMRDLPQRLRDREEQHAILTKKTMRFFANDRM